MKVEKDVPMPDHIKRGARSRYPFRDMEVGDSVFIEGEGTNGNAYSAAQMHGRGAGKRFRGRQEGNGLRIWRVE
jgi:hypothetical protein